MLVSFVIPCYHSEKTLAGVVDEIERTVPTLHACTAEIIMVNDNAPDACWTEIRRLCADHPEDRKGLCLSRNFGQHAALMAGIREAKGRTRRLPR
jgi:glycosyltransferase involved in cell wall biosynthesis